MRLEIDRKILNPVLRPDEKAHLTCVGNPVYSVENVFCAYDEPVASVDAEGVVTPLRGGVCRVIAAENGETAEVKLSVAPFHLDYATTPVMKLLVSMDGAKTEDGRDPKHLCDYYQIQTLIRRLDRMMLGLPRIIYLVGWQRGGHDYEYPCLEHVNPLLQGPEKTPLEGLRSLMRWARQYNTILSLHINLMDGYEDSEYWQEYVDKDVVAREKDGSLKYVVELQPGRPLRHLSYTREWDEGLTQRRLNGLLEMIPEIVDAHTIHVDAFHTFWFEKDAEGRRIPGSILPISPYHAEKYGITPEVDHATQCKIFEFMRARGVDITCECSNSLRIEPFFGLQPMMWWCGGKDFDYFKAAPPQMYTGGMSSGFMYGESMHGEEQFMRRLAIDEDFIGEFCRTTLPWYFLNTHERLAAADDRVEYSDGLAAYKDGENRIIRKNDWLVRENDTLFVPVMWIDNGTRYIWAYSAEGCSRNLILPEAFRARRSLRVFHMTPDGLVEDGALTVINGAVHIRLEPNKSVILSI